MIKAVDGKKIAEKDFYIKWDTDLRIGEAAARITRYSDTTMERKGIRPDEAFPTIKDWLDKADWIIAHNMLQFDIYLLRDYYKLNDCDYKSIMPKILDTNALARGVKMNMPFNESEGSLLEKRHFSSLFVDLFCLFKIFLFYKLIYLTGEQFPSDSSS